MASQKIKLKATLLILMIILSSVSLSAQNEDPFSWSDYNNNQGSIIINNPEFALTDTRYASRSMDYLEKNPSVFADNPRVFQEMVRANNKELSHIIFSFRNPSFNEVFNKALTNNPANTNVLNNAPLVMKDWAKENYQVDMQGKIKDFDGTSLTTLGEHSTTFNPKDFPGATVLPTGEIKLVKDNSIFEMGTVTGGKITKLESGMINIDGGNTNVLLMPKGTLHITNGNLFYKDLRYESVSPGGFTFNGEDFNTKISGSFLQYWKDDFGKEFLSSSGEGSFEFDRKNILVKPISPGQDFSYRVFDPNDDSKSFALICSQRCVTEGNPLIMSEGTKISYTDLGFVIKRERGHALIEQWGTVVAKVTVPELIGPGGLAGNEKKSKIEIVGGPIGIGVGVGAVIFSNVAYFVQDTITLPFMAIGKVACFVTKCDDKTK